MHTLIADGLFNSLCLIMPSDKKHASALATSCLAGELTTAGSAIRRIASPKIISIAVSVAVSSLALPASAKANVRDESSAGTSIAVRETATLSLAPPPSTTWYSTSFDHMMEVPCGPPRSKIPRRRSGGGGGRDDDEEFSDSGGGGGDDLGGPYGNGGGNGWGSGGEGPSGDSEGGMWLWPALGFVSLMYCVRHVILTQLRPGESASGVDTRSFATCSQAFPNGVCSMLPDRRLAWPLHHIAVV